MIVIICIIIIAIFTRNRLDVEAWVDAQLRDLFSLTDSDDLPVELDLDEINGLDAAKRADFVKVRYTY